MLVRSVARVGISLLGLWLAAMGVASLGDVVGSVYELERDAFVFSVPGNAGSVALIGVVAILAFRIAPGIGLIYLSDRIARHLIPEDVVPRVSPSELYVVGGTLLSFYLVIAGAADLVGSLVSIGANAFSEIPLWQPYLGPLLRSVVQVALGIGLYSHALRRAQRSAA